MTLKLVAPYYCVLRDDVTSTNDVAKELAANGSPSGLWVLANSQSQGRGRRGRLWVSDRGNFFASLYLQMDEKPEDWSQLSFVTALAVCEALREISPNPNDITLKWPNDVLYGGKKIAGLLLESSQQSKTQKGEVIIGIGINLAHSPDDAPYETTSFLRENSHIILPSSFLPILVKHFDHYFRLWRSEGFNGIRKAWINRAFNLWKKVTVNLFDESFEGVFIGLSDVGGARIQMPDGAERHILAGDIFPINEKE